MLKILNCSLLVLSFFVCTVIAQDVTSQRAADQKEKKLQGINTVVDRHGYQDG